MPTIPPQDVYGERSATGWWSLSVPAFLKVTRNTAEQSMVTWDEDQKPTEADGAVPPIWYNWEHRWALEFNKFFDPVVDCKVAAAVEVASDGHATMVSLHKFQALPAAYGRPLSVQSKQQFEQSFSDALRKCSVSLPENEGVRAVSFNIEPVGGRLSSNPEVDSSTFHLGGEARHKDSWHGPIPTGQ